jgi:hypothetical protein
MRRLIKRSTHTGYKGMAKIAGEAKRNIAARQKEQSARDKRVYVLGYEYFVNGERKQGFTHKQAESISEAKTIAEKELKIKHSVPKIDFWYWGVQ